ncbi:PREDICTED: integrin beta-7 [Nanorana parkeri]|uniref:integrin beta-7 n=1 Tax=Nanorana parkeri TaxID=125878 RepID=UPI0008549434|nr:PREDICTED: integrin beta-7 [Nanorana parkeri]
MKSVAFIYGAGFLLILGTSGTTDVCEHTLSCSECIKSHPSCLWCSAKNFTKEGESEGSRCATRLELLQRGCNEGLIIDPKTHIMKKDTPLSDNADQGIIIQLSPQKVHLTLRPGKKEKFQVRFKRAEGYPIDLYYLMDLSYSMKDDLENVKKLGSDIQQVLHKVTKSVRIGFGSFVDKTVLPYVNTVESQMRNPCQKRTERCQPPFSYRNVLSLTSNLTLFQERVSAENISGNLDSPEGGLDAMFQAAVCTDHIGWRNVTRLLVYASDDVFHMAGDGKLAGIYMPTDGHCHLNENGEYYQSNMYDYPSVGHLSQILTAANIQPIFAVTSTVLTTYQELSDLIPKSAVGELSEDSSNVVNLISQAYNSLSSTVNLEHVNLPKGIHISYDSHCPDSVTMGQPSGQCSGVKINEMVNFDVTIWIDEKMCQDGKQSFHLRVLGFSEELSVDVEPLCECNCNDEEILSNHCSQGLGNYSCGVCSCMDGHKGKLCECPKNKYDSDEDCIMGGSLLPCNGRGRCQCGQCTCNKHFRGTFCECDDTSCERHDGQLCGGLSRGVCSCGNCKCNSNFTGNACECSTDTRDCETGGNTCNGHGICKCNKCICENGYQSSDKCKDCFQCKTRCQIHRDCAECKAFNSGPIKDNCTAACAHVLVTIVKESERNETRDWCSEKDITFLVTETDDPTRVNILVKEKKETKDQTQSLILGMVLGIAFFGLLLIILYRVIVEMFDRKEYNRFLNARHAEQWNEAPNPLYQSATTTVMNPNFNQD